MSAIEEIKSAVSAVLNEKYDLDFSSDRVLINETRSEFEGDYTVVVFPFTKPLKMSPPQIAEELGAELVERKDFLDSYNVIKGFLNLTFAQTFWRDELKSILSKGDYGIKSRNGQKVLVEFSSPNTNKPLHLGHIRNILLGWSSSMLLDAAGYEVVKTQIINDRGVAICKSMVSYEKFGDGESPDELGVKGDKMIGDYYVRFEQEFRKEYENWQQEDEARQVYQSNKKEGEKEEHFYSRFKNSYFNLYSALGKETKEMLLQWERADEDVIALWTKMNGWVYSGFNETYKDLGVEFDHIYYESDTYKLGKVLIAEGLEKGVFIKRDDGSVWADLEDVGMDKKLVLRSDGTSVYMTQDLGTAQVRNKDHGVNRMVYVVGDEQDYHFKALFEILKKLEEPYADELYHLSYGMVDLPTGKMKSREGTVVDADDLIEDVITEARSSSESRGEIDGVSEEEKVDIFRKIGLAALKYFIIKVSPKKRMVFDPKESVDMQGQTGPYIQNAYVRIQSVLRKSEGIEMVSDSEYKHLEPLEVDLIRVMSQYKEVIVEAAENLDPSHMANYCYSLAKLYHKFWHDLRILSAESESAKVFRLKLSKAVAKVLKSGMHLLGIEMPSRM